MKAKRAIGTTVTLCLTWMTACGDGAAPGNTPRESIRDERYCEFATLFFGDEGITSDSWNTAGLNECPAEAWEALDFNAIREELGATILRPNGPRHWTFDEVKLRGSEDAERKTFGGIEFRFVANVQYDFALPPPGTFFFEARVKRDSEFLFHRGMPVYELIAPLGKRYVMQSYAKYVDTDLTMADLDGLESRISPPAGWSYRARTLEEDLLSEDFQGFASGMRDPLENTYQREEGLEYLTDDMVFVDLLHSETGQTWSAILQRQEAEALEVAPPWQRSQFVSMADKSVYSRSPEAPIDGRFEQLSLGDHFFYWSESVLADPSPAASGQLLVGATQKFHELTYAPGRTVSYLSSGGEAFVLVSEAADAPPTPAPLPPGWNREERQLSDHWRIIFAGAVTTIEPVGDGRIYQGPVTLPEEKQP